jgi:hypothetical protein
MSRLLSTVTLLLCIIASTIIFASALPLLSNLKSQGGNCGIVAAPCDNTWMSRFNQTFSFEAAGPVFVQLKCYWEMFDACLGNTNSTPLEFYYSTCNSNTSLWAYSPSVTTWVYYNNTQNLCLSRSKEPSTSSPVPNVFDIELDDCCLDEKGFSRLSPPCTRERVMRQQWMETPVTTNPYSRIRNQLPYRNSGEESSNEVCLTRVSDSC